MQRSNHDGGLTSENIQPEDYELQRRARKARKAVGSESNALTRTHRIQTIPASSERIQMQNAPLVWRKCSSMTGTQVMYTNTPSKVEQKHKTEVRSLFAYATHKCNSCMFHAIHHDTY